MVGTQTEAIASKAHGQHWGADPQHVCGLQLQEALRQCCSQTDVNSMGRPGIRRCEQDWNYQVQQGVLCAAAHRCRLRLQAAQPQVLEPDKCEDWIWAPWGSIPQPVFLPLQLLLDSSYSPFGGTQPALQSK